MGRWRAPQPRGSHYITQHGYATLETELRDKWLLRREVVKILSAAAAEGDRSENAEYIYRKKQLREIDRRIRYLQKRIDELTIVNTIPDDISRVFFGAIVTLETEQGEEICYQIVGPDEFDIAKGKISMDAPVAQALMKKSLDDEVSVQLPEGIQRFIIVNVKYEEQNS
ncbi:Transcription elongation factor GreB [hydrothermal vent metagenome]|uniref:Transcription elongation factor GreA n=1 Tax=hydrothermal vent metagenome TaxID=652676 RepID=A0A3B1B134_9ZZZZ